eukprot:TRINITY_DN56246_c0_g1_i1.p1 TRINITY_DN56246_c0_g1~~TRINITY_DN56246_c0_g1_i1.p1  ORF type:complete len:807 (-),score=124.02 TRINITY_DN56246_c0_g1_i1:136-2556(-)
MGIERILASSDRDFIEKSVDYIEECIVKFQSTHLGSFVFGFTGPNGRGLRNRAGEIWKHLAGRQHIDWRRVHLFLVDERFGMHDVAEDSSNANLLRVTLLKELARRVVAGEAIAALPERNIIFPDLTLSTAEASASNYCERLCELFEREGGPHLVTVGLGKDMSIASVFPKWYQGRPDRWAAATRKGIDVLCTETQDFEGSQRITVNLRVIRKSERIMVYLPQGTEEAWKRVKRAFEDERYGQKPSKRKRVAEATGMMLTQDGIMMLQARTPSTKQAAPASDTQLPVSPLDYILKYSNIAVVQEQVDKTNHYSCVVFGAAGDLAKKKTFPALFQLHLARYLPPDMLIIGCDDPAIHGDVENTNDFWEKRVGPFLSKEAGWGPEDMAEFKSRLHFVPVNLSDAASMRALDQFIRQHSAGRTIDNRVFYLALPSFVFAQAVENIRLHCWPEQGFARVIVEKPFGKNGAEATALSDQLKKHLSESEIFRIDHYLAKTLVMNLLTLRFANRELGSLFHAHHVANVRITFKEAIGVKGRARYFDSYGIIRDIMQNHLIQVLTLVAMEAPASLLAEDVRDEKVKVLKQIRPIDPGNCVIGQYDGYQEDPEIQKVNAQKGYASRCATFAACVLYLDNERWSGVPFIMKAGKALENQHTMVRIQFKKAPESSLFGDQPQNELVIRIQPNEAIYYKMLAKLPGLSQRARDVQQTVLDLDLKKRFELRRTPEAYEKLIHDVIQGESHNFVRRDELDQAWRIFDPLLRTVEIEEKRVPERYVFGSRGPLLADKMIDRMGFRRYTATGVPGFAEDDFD